MIVVKVFGYFTPDFTHGFLADKEEIFEKWYNYFFYIHIIFAPITIFAGILQFSLNRKSKLHRLSGYVYLLAVLFAATGALGMSLKTIGGIYTSISFFIMDFLWIYFSIKAFTSIRNKEIEKHQRFMIRSFILANSAILLRLFSFISNNYIDFNPISEYTFNVWFSWLPWLLIYEMKVLYFSKNK